MRESGATRVYMQGCSGEGTGGLGHYLSNLFAGGVQRNTAEDQYSFPCGNGTVLKNKRIQMSVASTCNNG